VCLGEAALRERVDGCLVLAHAVELVTTPRV
jgi:hypothetical protein